MISRSVPHIDTINSFAQSFFHLHEPAMIGSMRTRYSEDEVAVATPSSIFRQRVPTTTVRAAAEGTGFDPALWSSLAAMGAPGMALPESLGGAGAALTDLAVVADVAGAHLAPVPLIEHAVTARALARAGGHDDLVANSPRGRPSLPSPFARRPATPPASFPLAQLPTCSCITATVSRRSVRATPRRKAAEHGRPTPRPPCISDATAIDLDADGWNRTVDEWRALTAVAYVGLAKRAIEIGVAYTKERIQFGVLIGTFQALQHGFADAATSVEGAHLLAQRAIWALETDQPGASRLAGMALLFAAESARFAADRSVQYHGGYGFSEEYDIQLYHRHATAWILQLGDPAAEYARLADAEFGPVKGAA